MSFEDLADKLFLEGSTSRFGPEFEGTGESVESLPLIQGNQNNFAARAAQP